MEDYEGDYRETDSVNNKYNWIVSAVITGTITGLVIFFLAGISKYEGENAEFWFNAYDEENARYEKLKSCIEDYDSLDIDDQIDTVGVYSYCL